jgi:hypothetical protein
MSNEVTEMLVEVDFTTIADQCRCNIRYVYVVDCVVFSYCLKVVVQLIVVYFQSMSTTDNINSGSSTNATNENELSDLVSQLRQTINNSDWLTHNTSTKWEQDNPELAKQWREALNSNKTDDSLQS